MRKRFHGLKKVKVRQDWSKWTLYNLSRLTTPSTAEKTYFQQKWAAKSLSRAYHGEQIREKQWQRMFNKRIPAVVPMDPIYMARNDGSELASGRGSGLDTFPGTKQKKLQPTPYMQMVYYPIERRLDTAIFRALFASSTRQARQFVVHGFVTVNGKKMQYPGYLLNPGDMFQVDPERVMFATGEKKETFRRQRLALRRAKSNPSAIQSHEDWLAPQVEGSAEDAAAESQESAESSDQTSGDAYTPNRKDVAKLLASAKDILSASKDDLSGRAKQDLRRFRTTVKKLLSKKWPTDSSTPAGKMHSKNVEDLDLAFQALKARLFPADAAPSAASELVSETSTMSAEHEALLREALQRARENPIDDTKAYATPWRPRPFMSAFAFVPRYLEVNPKVCAAIYLRHPAARPGLGEVPTPFAQETSQLAFNWYLRRR